MSERAVQLESTLTCPRCGFAKIERMPIDACRFFYDCASCGATLRPHQGHCCVFCSYGSFPCPPIQLEGEGANCCGKAVARPS